MKMLTRTDCRDDDDGDEVIDYKRYGNINAFDLFTNRILFNIISFVLNNKCVITVDEIMFVWFFLKRFSPFRTNAYSIFCSLWVVFSSFFFF